MKFIEKAQNLVILDKLLREENTGTAEELAERFGISRTQMLKHIKALREIGLPIVYNTAKRTYYYTCPECIKVNPVIEFVHRPKPMATDR